MLQHNRQWLRWVPIILWVLSVIWVIAVQGEAFDVGMSMALITGPVGLGIPIVGVFVCQDPRTARVYVGSAIAGGASIAAMVAVIAAASVLSVGGKVSEALHEFGQMMGTLVPLLLGALMTTVLMIVWALTVPKIDDEGK